MTPVIAQAFAELHVGVAMWLAGDFWTTLHHHRGIIAAELEHAVEQQRWSHNHEIFARVKRTAKLVRSEYLGFDDLFMPVQEQGKLRGILVAGPIAKQRSSSAEIYQRWFQITKSQGRLTDPSFAEYVAATSSTLTLESGTFGAFERLLWCFARLLEGQGSADVLGAEAETQIAKLKHVRRPEGMWDAVQDMTSERSPHSWVTRDSAEGLVWLGLEQKPQHAVVGLAVGSEEEADPLDELLRRDAFQRAGVALCQKLEGVVCGRVGDQGIVLLVDSRTAPARTRAKLVDVATRATALARRFGFKLHVGVSRIAGAEPLATRYQAALWTAEKALLEGASLLQSEGEASSGQPLRKLRAELARSIAEGSNLLSPRFERYAQAALTDSSYRLEAVKSALEAGVEGLAQPLLASGSLDEKTFDDLNDACARAAKESATVMALLGCYRNLVAEMERAIQDPPGARRERSLQRALVFMRDHSDEPLTLTHVAKVAGFAPDYFSRLFKREEGITFERHLQEIRLSRAQRMLSRTALSVDGVRQLSGFRNRHYFHRAFKRNVGMTPFQYRVAARS